MPLLEEKPRGLAPERRAETSTEKEGEGTRDKIRKRRKEQRKRQKKEDATHNG